MKLLRTAYRRYAVYTVLVYSYSTSIVLVGSWGRVHIQYGDESHVYTQRAREEMATLFQRMFLPKSSFLQGLGVSSKWVYGTAAVCRHITTCKLAEGNHDHHSTVLLPKRLYSSETATGPPQSTMSFEEYKKLKRALKVRARVAGIPVAFVGIIISSAISVHMNPRMFEMTPEEITPIL